MNVKQISCRRYRSIIHVFTKVQSFSPRIEYHFCQNLLLRKKQRQHSLVHRYQTTMGLIMQTLPSLILTPKPMSGSSYSSYNDEKTEIDRCYDFPRLHSRSWNGNHLCLTSSTMVLISMIYTPSPNSCLQNSQLTATVNSILKLKSSTAGKTSINQVI